MSSQKADRFQRVADNRRARFDYIIEENIEAGLILLGTEVKSLRKGQASIVESFAGEMKGELFLLNATIQPYTEGNRFNHEPKRPRKLLLHKRQLRRLLGLIRQRGYTLIPLSIYFNDRGVAKIDIGLAQGRRKEDKRAYLKEQEWKRDRSHLLHKK